MDDGAPVRGRHAERVQRQREDRRIGFGHADHGRIDDDAHLDAAPGGIDAAPAGTGVTTGGVTDVELAESLFDLPGGVGDDAERQAQGGDTAQGIHHPRPHVRP